MKQLVLSGGDISREQAEWLAERADKEALYNAVAEIREKMMGKVFDTCSIVNARSGLCQEDCKWCAQASRYRTGVECYDFIDKDKCLELVERNVEYGIDKFSFVTSGRKQDRKHVEKVCDYARTIKSRYKINLCASMGLQGFEELQQLRAAGITRYHCNLEASPEYFGKLCTTHTIEDKIATIRSARKAGMDICSGGIIGMGESMADRISLAFKLKELQVKSIPINILVPIKGTPLEHMHGLTDDEVLTTVALFRFINPDAWLRFAGGRLQIRHIEEKAVRTGINSAILGDMLTTLGATVKEDFAKLERMGYELSVTGDRK